VDNGSYRLDRPFAFRAHAALRMVVDLGDLERSGSAIPTGQSGQPFDRWWGTALRGWAAGELHPMRFSRDRLGTDGVLVLRPR
jgi:acyl-homoserine lactone acylase PvdQ